MSAEALHRIDQCFATDDIVSRYLWDNSRERVSRVSPDEPLLYLLNIGQAFGHVLEGVGTYSTRWGEIALGRELYLAPLVIAMAEAFRVFKKVSAVNDQFRRTRPLRRAVKRLRTIFGRLIRSWGWKEIIGPRGLAVIADRLDDHREKYDRPCGRAVRTWRDGAEDRNPTADRAADRAERMGWEVIEGLPPEEAQRLAVELDVIRRAKPALAPELPTRADGLSDEWNACLRDIEREIVGSHPTPPSANGPPARTQSVPEGTPQPLADGLPILAGDNHEPKPAVDGADRGGDWVGCDPTSQEVPDGWIVSSQADLARELNRSPHTARLMEDLKEQGFIRDFKRLPKGGFAYIVFDSKRHQELSEKFADGKLRRPRPARNRP
jgi:hypothetical protein